MSDKNAATFLCAFPDVLAAIKLTGHRNGMRIQLEIPESELSEAEKMFNWREMLLEVTVRPADERTDHGTDRTKWHI